MKKVLAKIVTILIIMILLAQNITVFATSKSQLQNDQAEIDDKIDELKNEQEEIEKNKSEALKSVEELINKISSAESELDDLQEKVDELQAQIDLKEKDIQQKQEEYTKQEELLDARLVAMYESGETSYLDVLLTSSSMTDFLAKYYAASELIEYDKELISSIKEQKAKIEAEKTEIEENKKELDTSLASQKTKTSELKSLKKNKENQVAKLTAEEKETQNELEQFEKDKRDIEAKLKAIAQEEAKKANYKNVSSTPSACGYIFPVAGLSQSNINNKKYPSYAGHTGVDVNINVAGKSVVAVKAGTVVISKALTNSNGSYRSYGEYVVINHHDGTMTLYAHMLAGSRRVQEGDKVSQGQVLGIVGSTGNSTGTHLHFEVKVNGKAVNPFPYLP